MNCGFVGIKRSARVRTNNRPCQTKPLDQKCSRNKMLQDETASCCDIRHVVGSSLTKHELADVEDLAGSGQPTEARGILNQATDYNQLSGVVLMNRTSTHTHTLTVTI